MVQSIAVDIREIRSLAEHVIEELDKGRNKNIIQELVKIKDFDLAELDEKEAKIPKIKLKKACKRVFLAVKRALRELPRHPEEVKKLMERIILTENREMVDLKTYNRFHNKIKKDFLELLEKEGLEREDVTQFLEEIRGKITSREFKKIKRALEEKIIDTEILDSGPTYRTRDIQYLRKKILNFFKSPFESQFPPGEIIKFYLFGSLVNGFCNNPNKSHHGRPSDEGRTSDVDMLVVISRPMFNNIFVRLHPELVIQQRGFMRTVPIGLDNRRTTLTGPFSEIFKDLGHIRFAGKPSRPVHLVFTMEEDFQEMNFEDEPHIPIVTVTTPKS